MTIIVKKSKEKKPRIKWDRVREWYLYNNIVQTEGQMVGLKEVAEHFKLNYGSVRTRASKENWKDILAERTKLYTRKTEDKAEEVINQIQKEEVNSEMAVRNRHITLSRIMQSKASKKLQEIDPSTLTVRECIELLKIGFFEERRALGLPDGYTRSDNNITSVVMGAKDIIQAKESSRQKLLQLLAKNKDNVLPSVVT